MGLSLLPLGLFSLYRARLWLERVCIRWISVVRVIKAIGVIVARVIKCTIGKISEMLSIWKIVVRIVSSIIRSITTEQCDQNDCHASYQ
jgi:hypothetical protein